MARGDEMKHASVSSMDIMASASKKAYKAPEKTQGKTATEKSNYGAWGPIFKNKENFTNMHFC